MLRNDSVNLNEYSIAEKKFQDEVNLKIYNTIPYKDQGISIGYPVFDIDSVVFFHIENHVTFTTELINFLKEQKKKEVKN